MNLSRRKFSKYYLKLILRPLKIKRLVLAYFYTRIVMFLFIRGIHLPGFKKIKRGMDNAIYQKLERQKLVRDIKGERFQSRLGPHWFRGFVDRILFVFQTNKYLILIFSKVFG